MKVFIEYLKEIGQEAKYIFDNLAKYISNLILLAVPYVMFKQGYRFASLELGKIRELSPVNILILFLPVIALFIALYLRYYANTKGTGDACPVPKRRFTEIDDSGMVSAENERLQEMLLYVADVEEYLTRKGRL